ncbi:MAG: hypothetical protein AB7O77_14355 [Phycisphaerales bacterium]
MNEFLRWALDLKSLSFGQDGVEFGFARPLATWGWALAVAGAGALAWWSYRRIEGPRAARAVLGVGRGLVLLLLVLLICGPRLIKPNETQEKDWVIVLADRSASMTIKDAPSGAGAEGRTTREAQLREALARSSRMWEQLGKDRTLVWLGFDVGAFELPKAPAPDQGPDSTGAWSLDQPMGRRTSIGRSLDQALRRAAGRPVSGVVVLSDGRSIDEPSRATMRRLEAEQIPVYAVPLGSAEPVTDYSVRRAEGPRSAFVNDFIPIDVEIERLGKGEGSGEAKVQLIDRATGEVLDEKDVTFQPVPGAGAARGAAPSDKAPVRPSASRVTLTTKAERAGKPDWSVRVVPSSGSDLVDENNSSKVSLELIDRPLRVAYFDGYPRWEQRYIKQLLVRERSMRGTSMILASGRRFVQEGDEAMTTLPRSPEEWREYDVIMIGDVRPEMFTDDQLQQIKDHVSIDGAGLIWIGGEGATPGAWRGTVLADLLPFVLSGGEGTGLPVWEGPVTITPTPLANRLGVLRLLPAEVEGSWWPAEIADPATGWNQFQWAQRLEPALLKPAVEVLALARSAGTPMRTLDAPAPGEAGNGDTCPLLVSMRFGAGRVLYLGTDEIWRWRYGRGELYAERFYLQMLRMLGRESLTRAGKLASLSVTPARAEVEQAVQVRLELIDQSLIDAAPASLRMRIVREGAVDSPRAEAGSPASVDETFAPVELVLLPEAGEGAGAASRVPGARGVRAYAATWIATESGRYRVEGTDPLLVGIGAGGVSGAGTLSATTEIWLPDDEMRRPEADHATLERLAQATGGSIMSARDLNDLPSLLPNRELRLAGEPDIETLWDTPLALFLLITLLTLEWVGRRLIRLA